MIPAKIKIRENKYLFILWDDNSESKIELKKLREFCPCATCLASREKQSIKFIPIFNENQIKVSGINLVGSYALSISWKDGHNTGIYEYSFLKNLAVSK